MPQVVIANGGKKLHLLAIGKINAQRFDGCKVGHAACLLPSRKDYQKRQSLAPGIPKVNIYEKIGFSHETGGNAPKRSARQARFDQLTDFGKIHLTRVFGLERADHLAHVLNTGCRYFGHSGIDCSLHFIF